MENHKKIIKIIQEHSQSSNKDLTFALEFIKEDFEVTKDKIIKLTHHLDKLESSYNLLLKEYQNRTKK